MVGLKHGWTTSARHLLRGSLLAALALIGTAAAHGLAGNRFFPGTLAFDDPAVGDELDFPLVDVLPSNNGTRDIDYGFQFTRLLTPSVALGAASGVIQQFQGARPQRTGFEQTSVEVKARIFEDDIHETLASVSLVYGIGASGSNAVGSGGPDTLTPGVFFGQGLGALPDGLAWLRPFGISGAFTPQFPLEGRSMSSGIPASSGLLFGSEPLTGAGRTSSGLVGETKNPIIVNWGISIQYSTYYLTDRFTGAPPKAEPLHQFVPLVEFAVSSPLQTTPAVRTAATADPGVAYVGSTWQVAAEAILPLDRGAGHGIGGRLQLLLFLDDLIPAVFGEPILGR